MYCVNILERLISGKKDIRMELNKCVFCLNKTLIKFQNILFYFQNNQIKRKCVESAKTNAAIII